MHFIERTINRLPVENVEDKHLNLIKFVDGLDTPALMYGDRLMWNGSFKGPEAYSDWYQQYYRAYTQQGFMPCDGDQLDLQTDHEVPTDYRWWCLGFGIHTPFMLIAHINHPDIPCYTIDEQGEVTLVGHIEDVLPKLRVATDAERVVAYQATQQLLLQAFKKRLFAELPAESITDVHHQYAEFFYQNKSEGFVLEGVDATFVISDKCTMGDFTMYDCWYDDAVFEYPNAGLAITLGDPWGVYYVDLTTPDLQVSRESDSHREAVAEFTNFADFLARVTPSDEEVQYDYE